jgi:hypothetical protein
MIHQRWGKVRENQQTSLPGSELEGALSKRRDSQEWFSAKKSYGEEIQLPERRMIQNTITIAMFTPRSESTFCFMNQFHVQRMGKNTFE